MFIYKKKKIYIYIYIRKGIKGPFTGLINMNILITELLPKPKNLYQSVYDKNRLSNNVTSFGE